MSETTLKLLELIKEGKKLNEICTELNKTPKQIFNHLTLLKNKGYLFNRKYYYFGEEISYIPQVDYLYSNVKPETYLTTSQNCNRVKAVVISDTHIGSKYERLDLLNEIYNYCTKNGIYTIFHCGDIIDNSVSDEQVPRLERAEYLLKNYPFDKNILTFTILGNHDVALLKETKQNIAAMLENYRHDIVNIGYMQDILKIKEDSITLYHPFTINSYLCEKCSQSSLILQGHSHKFKIENNPLSNNLHIVVPPLSDIPVNDYSYPSALELDIHFDDGNITNVTTKQLIYHNNSFVTINELQNSIKKKVKTI